MWFQKQSRFQFAHERHRILHGKALQILQKLLICFLKKRQANYHLCPRAMIWRLGLVSQPWLCVGFIIGPQTYIITLEQGNSSYCVLARVLKSYMLDFTDGWSPIYQKCPRRLKLEVFSCSRYLRYDRTKDIIWLNDIHQRSAFPTSFGRRAALNW